jgi:hypothetical protein
MQRISRSKRFSGYLRNIARKRLETRSRCFVTSALDEPAELAELVSRTEQKRALLLA